MKSIFSTILAFLLVGCSSSAPIKLHNLGDVGFENIAVISSSCSKECKLAIEKEGEFKGVFSSAFGTSIMGITIQSVNQQQGTTSYTSNCGGSGDYNVFNDSWDWSFNLEMAPGTNAISTYLADCNIRNFTLFPLKLNLAAGHKYALVAVSRKKDGAGYYENEAVEWYPAMYDYTNGNLVFGKSDSGWLKP